MPAGKYNDSEATGFKLKQYAAGALRDLVADSPSGQHCARAIELLADSTTMTNVQGPSGNEMGPITGWKAGLKIGAFSAVYSDVPFIAYW